VPLSLVVGGQFGSEGKGKIACHLAKERQARAVVRVGGPNSGHTVIDPEGRRRIFRQLPTAAVLPGPICVISAGSYIDLNVLRAEISQTALSASRLMIDPKAVIVAPGFSRLEGAAGLRERLGSTLSGTGQAVSQRINRVSDIRFARDEPDLVPYLAETVEFLETLLEKGDRVIAEGSQGFGLSVIHTPYYPYATSRDTTAAGVLSEIGISPLRVDEIVLVLRSFPIRVPGNSGPIPHEINWEQVTLESGSDHELLELTSVTRSKRRVARFDADIVRRAIKANCPTLVALNHVDYVDWKCHGRRSLTDSAVRFIRQTENQIGRPLSIIGTAPDCTFEIASSRTLSATA